MKKRASAAGAAPAPSSGTPSLAAGYLASVPLLLAYELGLATSSSGAPRAAAERVFALAFEPLLAHAPWLRLAFVLLLAALAAWRLQRGPGLDLAALARSAGVGILVGVVLGPLLVLLHGWLGAEPLHVADPAPRALPRVLRLVGAAPYEELLFRVVAYSCVYFVVRRLLEFFGVLGRAAQVASELGALLLSALVFALFHLGAVQELLDLRGEPFHAGLLLWRISAGLVLGGLFRWRGLGVAAWAHALFNLGLALGIRLL